MAEQTEPLTIIAVADVEIVDNDPESHFIHTREILRGGDITFGQLEIPLANSGEGQLGGLGKPGQIAHAQHGVAARHALGDLGAVSIVAR